MSDEATYQCIEELPRVIPVFPLPGVLLLPRGRLPLNIFEPRYREMTEDAMASHRMIGMIQPEDPFDALDHPAVYANGCIGRITALTETPDQRYLISLSGICRFRIARELPPEGLLYRRVYASYDEYADDLVPPTPCRLDRARLLPALRGFFQANGLTADWDAINGADDELLITCLAMACPFKPSEKQALLECTDEASRVAMMQALFEMAAHERGETDEEPVYQ